MSDLAKSARDALVAATVPVIDLMSKVEKDHAVRPSTGMALALAAKVERTGTPIYAGTVYGAEKAHRREIGKRQRQGRKLHRGRR